MAHPGDSTPVDVPEALRLSGGDPELFRELAGELVRHAPGQLTGLRTAIAAGDGRTLGLVAHSLRGALATIAAPAAAREAGELERHGAAGRLPEAARCLAALEAEVDRVLTFLANGAWRDRL
ncbi:MAG TPA: Hpt domain-containing protein [Methylomirabilota bacterium]|jgi:HPt (histidine-containing phosphotransfer) domain-containing protein|nr:Hpt domain-containing protein [Methylomirabilota bacterium]